MHQAARGRGIVDGLMVVCIGRWEASRCTSPHWAHALPSCRNLDCVGTVQTTAAHSASQRWRQVRAPHAKVELELESLFKSASQRHPWPLDRMTFNNVLSNTRPLVHLTNPQPTTLTSPGEASRQRAGEDFVDSDVTIVIWGWERWHALAMSSRRLGR